MLAGAGRNGKSPEEDTGSSRVPGMFYFLIWVLAVPPYSPVKVYQATVMIYDAISIHVLYFNKNLH